MFHCTYSSTFTTINNTLFDFVLLYSGFVEALLNNLGKGGTLIVQFCKNSNHTICSNGMFPAGYWQQLGYGSVVLIFCLVVCLVGAGIIQSYTYIHSTHIYMYTHVCTHMYMCVCFYTYTHTHSRIVFPCIKA